MADRLGVALLASSDIWTGVLRNLTARELSNLRLASRAAVAITDASAQRYVQNGVAPPHQGAGLRHVYHALTLLPQPCAQRAFAFANLRAPVDGSGLPFLAGDSCGVTSTRNKECRGVYLGWHRYPAQMVAAHGLPAANDVRFLCEHCNDEGRADLRAGCCLGAGAPRPIATLIPSINVSCQPHQLLNRMQARTYVCRRCAAAQRALFPAAGGSSCTCEAHPDDWFCQQCRWRHWRSFVPMRGARAADSLRHKRRAGTRTYQVRRRAHPGTPMRCPCGDRADWQRYENYSGPRPLPPVVGCLLCGGFLVGNMVPQIDPTGEAGAGPMAVPMVWPAWTRRNGRTPRV